MYRPLKVGFLLIRMHLLYFLLRFADKLKILSHDNIKYVYIRAN